MGMSEAKRAQKERRQVSSGHPKTDPQHPTGKSGYAQRHSGNNDQKVGRSASKALGFLAEIEAPPIVTAPTSRNNEHTAQADTIESSEAGTIISMLHSPYHRRDVQTQARAEPNVVGRPWVAKTVTTELRWVRDFVSRFRRLTNIQRAEVLKQLQAEHATSVGSLNDRDSSDFLNTILARNLVKSQNSPFTSACMHSSLITNPSQLTGEDERRFQATVCTALQRKNITDPAREGADNFTSQFPDLLVTNFLERVRKDIANPAATKKSHLIFVNEISAGSYNLKPEIESALRNLANDCLQQHGHLIGTHFSALGSPR